jgi:hypothetical protein
MQLTLRASKLVLTVESGSAGLQARVDAVIFAIPSGPQTRDGSLNSYLYH